jgi:hypothetical protein
VAQPGRALGSGPRGRRFKSYRPDLEIKGLRRKFATLFRFTRTATRTSAYEAGPVGRKPLVGELEFIEKIALAYRKLTIEVIFNGVPPYSLWEHLS